VVLTTVASNFPPRAVVRCSNLLLIPVLKYALSINSQTCTTISSIFSYPQTRIFTRGVTLRKLQLYPHTHPTPPVASSLCNKAGSVLHRGGNTILKR